MASFSYQLAIGADTSPYAIALGTAAPTTAKNIELRVDTAAVGISAEQIILVLQAFIRRLEDGDLSGTDIGAGAV